MGATVRWKRIESQWAPLSSTHRGRQRVRTGRCLPVDVRLQIVNHGVDHCFGVYCTLGRLRRVEPAEAGMFYQVKSAGAKVEIVTAHLASTMAYLEVLRDMA